MKTNGTVKNGKKKDERGRRGERRGKGRGIMCEQSEVYYFFTNVSTASTLWHPTVDRQTKRLPY